MRKSVTLRRVNTLGAGAVVAALVVAAWALRPGPASARAELRQLRSLELDMQTEYSLLQRKQLTIERKIAEAQAAATGAGAFAGSMTLEGRLSALRQMAVAHGWSDIQFLPSEMRSDADVIEQTFTVSASAGYQDLLKFLTAFEESAQWADISHFAVHGLGERCSLELTLSIYTQRDTALVPADGAVREGQP